MTMLTRQALFLALGVCLVVLVGAGSYAGSYAGSPDWVAAVAVGALAASVVLTVYLFRQDSDAVLVFAAVFLLGLTLFEVVYILYTGRAGRLPKAMAAGSALMGALILVVTYRRQTGPESADFPELLRAQVGQGALLEALGVQFVSVLDQPSEDEPFWWFTIFFQNCFAGTRTVSVILEAGVGVDDLSFQPKHSLRLGPAEVRRLSIPIASPVAPELKKVHYRVDVSGSGGRRVRLWRGYAPSRRVKEKTSIVLLLTGHIHFSEGPTIIVGPSTWDSRAMPLPSPEEELLWQPKLGTVPFVLPMP